MHRENKRQRDARKTSLMLLVVILVFLATEIPFMVITVLHTVHSRYIYALHTVQCTVHCTLPTVHCTLHTVHSSIYTHCTLYTAHCTLYIAHCSLQTVHSRYIYTVHTVYCILHTAHCTLHTVRYKLKLYIRTAHYIHCDLSMLDFLHKTCCVESTLVNLTGKNCLSGIYYGLQSYLWIYSFIGKTFLCLLFPLSESIEVGSAKVFGLDLDWLRRHFLEKV